MYLYEAQNPHSQIVADLLIEFGLIDLMHHFQKRLRCHHLKMWTQVFQVTAFRDRCDYICGTNRHLFEVVGIRRMKNYYSDHFAVRAHLLQCPTLCNALYHRWE